MSCRRCSAPAASLAAPNATRSSSHATWPIAFRPASFPSAPQDTAIQEGPLDVRVIGGAWHVRGQRTNPFAAAIVPEILKADIVHCHQHHILMSSAAAAVCRMTGRRVFATDLGGGGWDVSAYVSTDRWFHAHLHISEYSRRISQHADKPWARVILGGVDTDKFSPDPSAKRTARALVCRPPASAQGRGRSNRRAARHGARSISSVRRIRPGRWNR